MKEFKPKVKPIRSLIIAVLVVVGGSYQDFSMLLTVMSFIVFFFLILYALILFKIKVVIEENFFAVNYKTTDKEKKNLNVYTENGQIFYQFSYDQLKDISINAKKNIFSIDVITMDDVQFNFSLNFFEKKVRLRLINEFIDIKNKIMNLNKLSSEIDLPN